LPKRGQEAVAIFFAPDMNVAGGAQKLREKVKALEGVLEVDINYILNTVSIKYDSDKVTLPKIRKSMGH
jgi:copper chaperone CopZ